MASQIMTNFLLAGILAILILILVQLMVDARMREGRDGKKPRGYYYLIDGFTGIVTAVILGLVMYFIFGLGADFIFGISQAN